MNEERLCATLNVMVDRIAAMSDTVDDAMDDIKEIMRKLYEIANEGIEKKEKAKKELYND